MGGPGCDSMIVRYALEKGRGGVLRSHMGGDSYRLRIPDGFDEYENWSDGDYRRVWVSDTEMAIFTYCEGDLSLEVLETERQFRASLRKAGEFYEEH